MRLALPDNIGGLPIRSITAVDCSKTANTVYQSNFIDCNDVVVVDVMKDKGNLNKTRRSCSEAEIYNNDDRFKSNEMTVVGVELSPATPSSSSSAQALSPTNLGPKYATGTLKNALIEGMKLSDFDGKADVWTMSPPCQPYTNTRNAHQKDDKDNRSKGLYYLMSTLKSMNKRPRWIVFENVKAFATSKSLKAFKSTLKELDYSFQQYLLSPITSVGLPNHRMRFYLIAESFCSQNNQSCLLRMNNDGIPSVFKENLVDRLKDLDSNDLESSTSTTFDNNIFQASIDVLESSDSISDVGYSCRESVKHMEEVENHQLHDSNARCSDSCYVNQIDVIINKKNSVRTNDNSLDDMGGSKDIVNTTNSTVIPVEDSNFTTNLIVPMGLDNYLYNDSERIHSKLPHYIAKHYPPKPIPLAQFMLHVTSDTTNNVKDLSELNASLRCNNSSTILPRYDDDDSKEVSSSSQYTKTMNIQDFNKLLLPLNILSASWAAKRLSIVGKYDTQTYCFTYG